MCQYAKREFLLWREELRSNLIPISLIGPVVQSWRVG
jgi:hypothetical protein